MTARTVTAVAGIVLLGVAVPSITVPSATANDVDRLPPTSAQERAESIKDIDTRASITPLESRSSSGAGTEITLDSDILFEFDKSALTSRAKRAIGDLIEDAPREAKVQIVGHTDSLGTDARNRKLSTDRARAVAGVIAAARGDLHLATSGRGSAEPVEPNMRAGKDNPEGRAQNRRVEVSWGAR